MEGGLVCGSATFVERRSLPFMERKTLRSVFWIKRCSGNEVDSATSQRSAVLHEHAISAFV